MMPIVVIRGHPSAVSGPLLSTRTIIMKFFLVPLFLASTAMAANMGMNIAGGAYNFGYATGDVGGHSRVESGSGNSVSGSYSYVDPNGDLRTVQYTAGPGGFQASGDTGVDRRTAAAAAALAAIAPKAPVAAPIAAPATPWYNPIPYGGASVVVSNPAAGVAHYMAKW
ncbi:adult-specific rigid cuticular protein 11.9 [Trichonephila clavata]|uniref:Adult-specific rigid cuticular protein 11.9 n=1 Tax=Trichonephila clavata TaxID=2740835 RepID=A0A8X6JTK0_TRICU|nr:adult-specific rigid cuticular protein 11.9 [Trichonephila clavata]